MKSNFDLETIKEKVLSRDPLCLWCLHERYVSGKEDWIVNSSAQAHHVIKKKWLAKKEQKRCDVIHNLVGVCEACHYKRLVDNYEALKYFAWYLNDRCGYGFYDWYSKLPMISKERIDEW